MVCRVMCTCTSVQGGGFILLRCLVDMYRELTTPDYVSMCQCLIFLDDPLAVADILDKLVHGDQDSTLMAYQIAFDLYESATQQFLARVLQALKPTTVVPTGLYINLYISRLFFEFLDDIVLYLQLRSKRRKLKKQRKLRPNLFWLVILFPIR